MMDAFRLDGGYKKKITSDGSVAAETHKGGGESNFFFFVPCRGFTRKNSIIPILVIFFARVFQ